MTDNTKELQQASPSRTPISAQDAAIKEVEEAMTRLRICPKQVLGSLGHLRIEKARIKPLEDETSKAGGNADVEAAILVPDQSLNSPKSGDTEYIAVKKLRFDTDTGDDRTLAPLAHEVKLLNDVTHPNVVKIVGFVADVEQGIGWMLFKWEKNGNLREFVRSASWELPERVSLINDVARGLSYLHGRTPPICHGDLKSLNILVNSDNRAIITDFGSARRVDSATGAASGSAGVAAVVESRHRVTSTATVESLTVELAASGVFITMAGPAWTIRWAAPELLEGESPGLASDIWALGWICWEAITGNFPFNEEKNDINIVLHITKGELPVVGDDAQLKQVKALCSLMGQCWKLDANERPTAIRCQQEISFMNQVMPSSSKISGSATTRSSGLLHALGSIQLQNGVVSEAEKLFQESLVVANSVGDKGGSVRALNSLGEVYKMRSEYLKAEESYIQARDAYSSIGDQIGFANSLRGLGDIYRIRNEYFKAEESYIQARDTFSQIGNRRGFANSVKSLGDVYQMRSEYSKAEEAYVQARDIYSQIGNQLGFATSVRRLGDIYRMRSEDSKAEKSYMEARDTYSQIGNWLGFANSVRNLGDIYQMRSESSKAEESYIQARDAHSQIGNRLGFAHAVKGLGDVYQMRSDYSKAEESYIQARDTYSQIGSRLGFATSVRHLGQVYQKRSDYFKAEDSYVQARDTYSQIRNQLGFANSVMGLGDVYQLRSEYSKAEESYIQARDTYSQIGNQRLFASAVQGLGRAYSVSGEYAKAEKAYLEAQAVYRRVGRDRDLANNFWYLGLLRRSQAQYGDAERFVCEASILYAKLGLKGDVAECDDFLTEVRQLMSA